MKFGQKITKSTSKKGKKYFEVLSESFSSLEFFSTLFASRFNLQFIRRLLGFEPGSPACLRSSFAVALFNCWCIPSILVSFNLEYFNICVLSLPKYVKLSSKNLWRCLPWLFLYAVIFL